MTSKMEKGEFAPTIFRTILRKAIGIIAKNWAEATKGFTQVSYDTKEFKIALEIFRVRTMSIRFQLHKELHKKIRNK